MKPHISKLYKIELIKTLNSVSAGKIYVEIERARLIKRLSKIKEEQGQIAEAADLMQEIAVETFGDCVWTAKIMCVHKYFQGRLALQFLMLILQKKRRSQKKVRILWKRHLLIFHLCWNLSEFTMNT